MRKIILRLISLVLVTATYSPVASAESYAKEVGDALDKYIKFSKKGKDKEAKERLSYAYRRAHDSNTTDIDDYMRNIIAYAYCCDKMKRGERGHDFYSALSSIIVRGTKPGAKPYSFLISQLSAHAHLEQAKLANKQYMAIRYVSAVMLLDALAESKLEAEYPKSLNGLFNAAGVVVSTARTAALMEEALDSINDLDADIWFRGACTAVDNKDIPNREAIGSVCLGFAKKKGHIDAEALEGFICEHGKFTGKDAAAADSLYAVSAARGSIWGGVQHALRLYEKGKFKEALVTLERCKASDRFQNEGGNYVLGLLAEKGIGKGDGIREAMKYYTANNEKCRWGVWKKNAQKRIDALEKQLVTQEEQEMIKTLGPQTKWNARELAGLAESYERIKDKENAMRLRKLAADKGHGRSANIYAVNYYNENGRSKGDMTEVAGMLLANEKSGYLPTLYNLAVIHMYGYGVAPDHEKTKKYLAMYQEYAEDENPDDYSKEEYLPLIAGTLYTYDSTFKGISLAEKLKQMEKPGVLYKWASYREHDSRPEVWQYFYRRAAALGSEKAAQRLRELNLEP